MGGIYYLDVSLKGQGADLGRAKQIVRALGEIRDGKGYRVNGWEFEYTGLEDRAVETWKFEYVDFKDRAAALKALAVDLDRIDGDWRDCLITD